MKITIVGAGKVGCALGTNLVGRGHVVRYAARSSSVKGIPEGSSAVPVEGAAQGTDLVVLAVPFGVVGDVVPQLGLRPGAILVDATNPFGQPLPAGHTSGASVVAQAAPDGVHVVKAFDVLGAEHMPDPPLPDGHRPLLPVAGDDPASRDLVVALATGMGFDAVAVGDLSSAGLLEEAARYWGLIAFRGGRGRGFVLVAHQRPQD